ncbi:MAG: hydroxyacylglutathione hydrolase [Waddliaceae bacterium]|nr:hydroxyacylglutathione hydrolase [Waddliaceae bacterium]MBT7263965.1 hydroxyacylglutathione hydrolase [Waddliaceae bacterium]MBT7461947.1 hydroxyacylglutathione hydrolase [Waddliaceae bacterium]
MDVISLPALTDNYIHVVRWEGQTCVVDPGDADVVLKYIKEEGFELHYILVTHHHHDHVDGIEKLKKTTEATVIGPEDERIPCLDRTVYEGEELVFGPCIFQVFEVPGHTTSDVAYYLEEKGCLFSGDFLFTGSCGRIFEGTARQMFSSMQKVVDLPDDTLIYCGHEYTAQNMRFAISIEPDNVEVKARLDDVEKRNAEGRGTVPAILALEKKTNPFFRCDDEHLKEAVDMPGADAVDVFAKIRRLKDVF